AQEKFTVNGTVVDVKGVPLVGANVLEKGTSNGTLTDFDGKFELKLKGGSSTLAISYVGFLSQEVAVQERINVTIVLEEDLAELGEVVITAFGTQKKSSVVSAITSVKPADLRIPSSNLTTAFAGAVPGMISYQTSGEPGADNAEFFIRGVTTFGYRAEPLILIDGMESNTDDLARLDVDDIESFSVMKDATSAALYGSRGANGVILVKTKDGVKGKAQISVKFENYISSNTTDMEFADPVTYMTLWNEALQTRGALYAGETTQSEYSQNTIDAVMAGKNPYVYPATDWMKMLFKDQAVNQRVNINVSGGGDIAKYYLSATYTHDGGILRIDDRNDYNTEINLNKFQVRSNNIINITNKLEARIQTYIAVDDYTGPLGSASDVFRNVGNTSPTKFPAYYEPDTANLYNPNILFGNFEEEDLYGNPYAESIRGYRDKSTSKLNAQINLRQIITDNLSLRAKVGYDRNSEFTVNRAMVPAYYNIGSYDEVNDVYTLRLLNESSNPENTLDYAGGSPEVSSVFYGEFAADYNKTFNEVHDFQAMLVSTIREKLNNNASDNNTGTALQNSLPSRNIGLAGRFSYGYNSKYFAEFVFGYNGSERFAKKERWGYFPSLGLGWNVSKEKFWDKLRPVVNNFKITSTYGLVGNDDVSAQRFYYLSQVELNSGNRSALFGENFQGSSLGVSIDKYANDQITWETAKKFNLGLQFAFFNNKIELNADYFHEMREDIFTTRSGLPASLGLAASIEANSGKAKSHGIEFNVKVRENWGKNWWVQGTGNFTYATSEYLEYDEVDYSATPWRSRIGNRINQSYGYVAERLFIDDYDVANSPEQQFAGGYGPGDIKYKDINNDGIIDQSDIVPIGTSSKPEINFGFGFSFGYKNFDFNCFFNGLANRTFFIDSEKTAPFITNTQEGFRGERNLLKVYADNHWSEENRDVYALWPRLSTTVVSNNAPPSTWFMRDGSLLRLKQLEIGYTLPKKWLGNVVDDIRFYASGTNLFTLSKFDLWDVELAGNAYKYPIQRVYNIGVRANF
ncbi:MAG: SusC/RagA family TonB-linked outer membrane protein, partial [Flavobacteriaceae bacterium]